MRRALDQNLRDMRHIKKTRFAMAIKYDALGIDKIS